MPANGSSETARGQRPLLQVARHPNTAETVKDSIRSKLESLSDRFEEVGLLLSTPDIIGNQNKFRALSIEYSELEPVVKCFAQYRQSLDDVTSAEQMLKDPDADLRAMAQDELAAAKTRGEQLELQLQKLLLPTDPYDNSNIFLYGGSNGGRVVLFAGSAIKNANIRGIISEAPAGSGAALGDYSIPTVIYFGALDTWAGKSDTDFVWKRTYPDSPVSIEDWVRAGQARGDAPRQDNPSVGAGPGQSCT